MVGPAMVAGAMIGLLHEYMVHERLKAYVCILYASPCAPLLVLWPGEVEGTSLAMAQGKASPVPAPAPMFRVSAVLRRYDADVPPTAVGACGGRRLGPACAFSTRFFAAISHSVGRSKRRRLRVGTGPPRLRTDTHA